MDYKSVQFAIAIYEHNSKQMTMKICAIPLLPLFEWQ